MKIGFTYDLRTDYLKQGYTAEETAEFDAADTIDAIETALTKQGFSVERIGNIYQLVTALANGKRWDLVFNIAEGLHGLGREAQVPALLDAYHIPYTFSDPVTLSLTLDKAVAKRIAHDCGVITTPFVVINSEKDLTSFPLSFPVFAKPLAEGTGKGITAASRIDSLPALKSVCINLLQQYRQPVLVETFLSGREFTVALIGNGDTVKTMGVMEIVLRAGAEPEVYSFTNKEYCEELVEYRLANDAEAQQAALIAHQAWQALGCRDCARIDLRSDANGVPHFLEVNPLPGLHPTHSDLCILMQLAGYSYDELLKCIMTTTLQRLGISNKAVSPTAYLCV